MTPVNTFVGQPFLQEEIISTLPLPKTLQNISTLPYTLTTSTTFSSFIQSWGHKLYPDQIFLNKTYSIVTTVGGSAFVAASYYYACQQQLGRSINITSNIPPPIYSFYKTVCSFVPNTVWIDWEQDDQGNYTFPKTPIDLLVVISPNNPTGQVTSNLPSFSYKYLLLDTVYDNYLFTQSYTSVNVWAWNLINNPQPGDPPLAIVNSFSKFGFAGFRVGYLFTNQNSLLSLCQDYISNFIYGNPTFNFYQLINDNLFLNNSFFTKVNYILVERQKEIRNYINSKFIVNKNFLAPYLFVKINPTIFLQSEIIVQPGSKFLVSDEYSRISLMIKTSEWKSLIQNIQNLPSIYK